MRIRDVVFKLRQRTWLETPVWPDSIPDHPDWKDEVTRYPDAHHFVQHWPPDQPPHYHRAGLG